MIPEHSLMKFAVAIEAVPASENLPGFYYAHVPSLGLTTHGKGRDGALQAARELVKLWLEEKQAHRETVPTGGEMVLETIEV